MHVTTRLHVFEKKEKIQILCWTRSPDYEYKKWILLHGIQLTHVQRYQGSTEKMVLSYKIFTLNEANTYVALPNACRRSVRALS
jgi:hypothetical protein